jgi:hypothetical protein
MGIMTGMNLAIQNNGEALKYASAVLKKKSEISWSTDTLLPPGQV